MRPDVGEYQAYFGRYIDLVAGDDIVETLAQQVSPLRQGLLTLPESSWGHRYADGKWSVRQVVGHMIDTERVFGYRALWIARDNRNPMPGFDQEPFAEAAQHDRYPLPELVDEFTLMRESHVLMFRHFDDAAWRRVGEASGHPVSARAVAFILAGHVLHHIALLRSEYDLPLRMA